MLSTIWIAWNIKIYMGQTQRRLHKRIEKHKTTVYKHSYVTNHEFDFQNLKIFECARQRQDMKLKKHS